MLQIQCLLPRILHTKKPRRYQSDNLRQARGTTEEQAKSNAEKPAESYTLERAIRFYQDNAVGEYRALYTATASWLRGAKKKPIGQNCTKRR